MERWSSRRYAVLAWTSVLVISIATFLSQNSLILLEEIIETYHPVVSVVFLIGYVFGTIAIVLSTVLMYIDSILLITRSENELLMLVIGRVLSKMLVVPITTTVLTYPITNFAPGIALMAVSYAFGIVCINVFIWASDNYSRLEIQPYIKKKRLGKRSDIPIDRVRDMCEEGDIESLIEVLETDPNFRHRAIAAECLGEIADESTIENLRLALNDEEDYVKVSAAIALCRLYDFELFEKITEIIESSDVLLRELFVSSLSEIDDVRIIRLLEKSTEDSDERVRDAARASLKGK